MYRRRRRRVRVDRIFKALIALGFVFALAFGALYYLSNYHFIPKQLIVDNQSSKLKDLSPKNASVLYYDSSFKKYDIDYEGMFKTLKEHPGSEGRNMRLGQYEVKDINENYKEIKYKLSVNNEVVNTYSFVIDKNTDSVLKEDIFGENIYKYVSGYIRSTLKQQHSDDDYYFSKDFYLKTDYESIQIDGYRFADDKVYIQNNEFNMEIPVDLNVYGSDLNIDLGYTSNVLVKQYPRFVDPNRKILCLTFDDGPHDTFTNELLRELERYDGSATFYMVGRRANNEKGHKVIFDVLNAGSEVGNHSYTHASLVKLSGDALEKEVYQFSRDVEQLTNGEYKVKTYRVPYGAFSPALKEYMEYPIIQWNVDPEDWKARDIEVVKQRILEGAKDGGIIVLHDIHPETKQAVLDLIPTLIDEGYQLASVVSAADARGIPLEAHKVYYGLK
ncbi:hypothetical protein EII25_03095 [Erysipelotrichaceae bacterium OH741_COT-311]|nr:hypothetical protein EII25_03095 [Erysipelotrichaceae bacterium OH741_COT-311]